MFARLSLAFGLFSAILGAPDSAHAVHASGMRYEVLGFSNVGTVLVRQVDVQHGVIGHEVRALAGGGRLLIQTIESDDDLEVVERALKDEHGVVWLPFPGPVAPDRSGALALIPGPIERSFSYTYDVRLQDGDGIRSVAEIPVAHTCPPEVGGTTRLSISWTPDGSVGVVAGGVEVEDPCGEPTLVPAFVTVRRGRPAMATDLHRMAIGLERRVRALSNARVPQARFVARQLLAVAPERPSVRLLLARLRAETGDIRGSLALLWTLPRLSGGLGLLQLDFDQPWTDPLRGRASWRALTYVVEDYRASLDLPFGLYDLVGPPWPIPSR